MKFLIATYGNLCLREWPKCDVLPQEHILNRLIVSCETLNGLGMAANQLEIDYPACSLRTSGGIVLMINPTILESSKDTSIEYEFCYSLPGIRCPVERSNEIMASYFDLKGEMQKAVLDGLEARALQHEIDHLRGKLICDYVIGYVEQGFLKNKLKRIYRMGKRNGFKMEYKV